MPDRAAGPLARLANYQISLRSRVDVGVVTIPPIFADPRAATTLPESIAQGIDPRAGSVLPEIDIDFDPRAATTLPVYYAGPLQAGLPPLQELPDQARGPRRPSWYWFTQQSRNLEV